MDAHNVIAAAWARNRENPKRKGDVPNVLCKKYRTDSRNYTAAYSRWRTQAWDYLR